MEDYLNEENIVMVTEELEFLRDFDYIDFSDIDTLILEKSFNESPLYEFLPECNPEFEKELPEKDYKGQYVYTKEGRTITVPPKFVPMVDYVFRNFSGAGAFLPSQNIFELIWDYVEQFVHLPFEWKKNLLEQIEDILKSAEDYEKELIEIIQKLKKDHEKDPVFNMTLLLPKCFRFLCGVLTARDIPARFKAEISLSLIYLTSPIDFIPEGLIAHPVALMDDLGILTYVIKKGLENGFLSDEHFEKYWEDDDMNIQSICKEFSSVETFLGKGFFEMIFGYFKKKMLSDPLFS